MSDRRRRVRNRRSSRNSQWLTAVQLLVMAAVLVFIFVFRDYLSISASNIFSAFDKSDLQVAADASGNNPEQNGQPGRSTPKLKVIETPDDAGTPSGADSGGRDVTTPEASPEDTHR
jgi:hypothetical protein